MRAATIECCARCVDTCRLAGLKQERGLAALNHRLYAGLLRYQDRTEGSVAARMAGMPRYSLVHSVFLADAILHCQIETRTNPTSLVGHHTWGIVLSDNFRAEEAMQHYLSQLRISPDHPHSYNGVGTTLHDLRRYEDAIFFYKVQVRLLVGASTALRSLCRVAARVQPAQ